jgi:hypothetical protein
MHRCPIQSSPLRVGKMSRQRRLSYRNVMLDKYFALAANRTNVRTECLAGFTTFLTMSAILFVNPDILAAAGMRGRGQ